jgi:hypothetical protein
VIASAGTGRARSGCTPEALRFRGSQSRTSPTTGPGPRGQLAGLAHERSAGRPIRSARRLALLWPLGRHSRTRWPAETLGVAVPLNTWAAPVSSCKANSYADWPDSSAPPLGPARGTTAWNSSSPSRLSSGELVTNPVRISPRHVRFATSPLPRGSPAANAMECPWSHAWRPRPLCRWPLALTVYADRLAMKP